MKILKKATDYFSKAEIALWTISMALIVAAFLIFKNKNYVALAASVTGVTALILNAKGHPAGQALMIVFSILYGIISYSYRYYGEMITYLGMSMPMAVVALVAWLKHPYEGKKSQVTVGNVGKKETVFMLLLAAAVTTGFYFVLKALDTTNLFFSTVSVTTSFLAVYLTFRRSSLFPLAYAANDVVLIILWAFASRTDASYFSVIVCFVAFLANDFYGFINWEKMRRAQHSEK